jgi:rhodanese-related sulfurtransferase
MNTASRLLRGGALALVCLLPGTLLADTVKGRIKSVSTKAGTIQLEVKDKPAAVVRFDAKTVIEGASGIDDLNPPDLIEAEFTPGQPASRIKKIVFGLPPGVEIDINEMLAVLQGQRGPYLLGDARPLKRYQEGHVPSAVSTPAVKAEALLAKLPADKNQLLVFYCGGPTCPFTKQAYDIASKAGHTNVKGFQAGIPGWNKAKLPIHSNRAWLAENLNEHLVLLDVRDPALAAGGHLPTAVTLPTARLQGMTQEFVRTQQLARLPGVSDSRSPIVLYAETHTDRDVLLAYKELRSWGYDNVGIMEGGLAAWRADGLPLTSGALATSITYSKALAPGAIDPKEFLARVDANDGTVFLDVRTDAEIAKLGALKGSVHIPLDQLDARLADLPKDQEVLVYCENGIRAEMAYETLRSHGLKVRFLNETTSFDGAGNLKL